MEEIIIERTTLWDLLSEPSFSLHLPRFALFLSLAIIFEIIYSKKKLCLMCSASTVILLLVTGIGGIIGIYYNVTSSFYDGDRVPIPHWYYPVIGVFITGITFVFVKGANALLNDRLISNFVIRYLMFGITVYFAITTAMTPGRINKSLEAWEKTVPHDQFQRPRETDKAFHILLDAEILLNQASLVEIIEQEISRQFYVHIDDFASLEKKINEGILVEVNEADEHLLNWNVVAEILLVCAKEGFPDVEINDFRWQGRTNERENTPHFEETDSLLIQKKDVDHSQDENSSAKMSPDDQYDWDLIHAWCKRNDGKHAVISFGGSVTFDVLKEVVRIFNEQGVTFDLNAAEASSDPEYRRSIKLDLFSDQKQEQVPNP